MKRLSSLVLVLLFSACASVPKTPPPAEPVHVVIVGTTDVHGWFAGHIEAPAEGKPGLVWGGLAPLSSYVQTLRQQYGNRVLVVDSGDMFQGTLESNMFEGEAVIRGYNAIGYSAAAVGNHEFDFGPLGPDAIARTPDADPLGALKRNAALAKFPMLSANMFEKASGKHPDWARPWAIANVGGVKIGIIGLSTPDTPNVTMTANVVSLSFTDPVAATIKAAKELREKGVDAIIVIAHMGGRCTDLSNPHNNDSCQIGHEAMELLDDLPEGTIDALFAGHTHAQMRHYIKGVATVQAGPFSREFSTVDLWIDPVAKKVAKSEIRPHTMICSFVYEGTELCDPRNAAAGAKLVAREFGGATMQPDARVAAVIEPFLRKVAAKRDEKVGINASARFTRNYQAESELGNLIADAMRESASADVAFMNSGGIRSDLRAGELTYADIFAVSPFDNFPAVVTMTGDELKRFLEVTTVGTRGIMQVSGLRYSYKGLAESEKASGKTLLVSVTLPDGSPLDPTKQYRVIMPDFLAAGGDGTQEVMATIPRERINISYLKPIRDVLVDVLSKRPQPIAPKLEGRITVLPAS